MLCPASSVQLGDRRTYHTQVYICRSRSKPLTISRRSPRVEESGCAHITAFRRATTCLNRSTATEGSMSRGESIDAQHLPMPKALDRCMTFPGALGMVLGLECFDFGNVTDIRRAPCSFVICCVNCAFVSKLLQCHSLCLTSARAEIKIWSDLVTSSLCM